VGQVVAAAALAVLEQRDQEGRADRRFVGRVVVDQRRVGLAHHRHSLRRPPQWTAGRRKTWLRLSSVGPARDRSRMKPTSQHSFVALLAALFLFVATLPAQAAGDVRELSIPTANLTLTDVTKSTIDSYLNNGFRIIDVEYRSGAGSSTRFDAALVESSGAYSIGYWWYFNATAADITNAINANQARLIDLESYEDSNGNRRFAAIMVDNTGVNGKAWWWLYDTNPTAIGQFVASNAARIVDLDTYELNGTTRYLAVMISNTGADYRQWWWYIDVSSSQINSYADANNARVYDIEKNIGGAFDCVMIRDPLPKDGYCWTGLLASQVAQLQQDYGVRAFDIQRYTIGFGIPRFAMATINNSNTLTTEVGNRMRNATDGRPGCWLQEVNGANLAWLNGETTFEPAEAITVLHHAHSMRRIDQGSSQPISLVPVFQDYSPTSAGCPVDSNLTLDPLVDVLAAMMLQNDQRRTQAIVNYYGSSNLHVTASTLLAMHDTGLNHRIGCYNDALADPNTTSLRDLHRLHESVANGWLGGERQRFYDLMPSNTAQLGLDLVIASEASQLGMSAQSVACFRSFLQVAHKGGDYDFASVSRHHVAEFGWISVPFVQAGVLAPREFTFGAFVNNASNGSAASSAVYGEAIPELLRATIRAGLASWAQSAACVTVVGSGCGSPVHTQSASAPPRVGTTVDYHGSNAYPDGISVFTAGLSSVLWEGVPLPVSIAPLGGEPGCMAFNDVVSSALALPDAVGNVSFAFAVPTTPSLAGLDYLTQLWSFGPSSVKTSNSLRNVIGL